MIGDELRNIDGRILIYGAHLIALECARWLINEGVSDKIAGIAVTDMEGNPDRLEGIPVRKIEEYSDQDQELTVVIAIPEKYHAEVEKYGRDKGFDRFLKVGTTDMSELKGKRFLLLQKNFQDFPYFLEEDENDPSWLNLYEGKDGSSSGAEKKKICHYEFPTLFYLEDRQVFKETMGFSFQRDYKKICGQYRNIHTLPCDMEQRIDEKELRKTLSIYMAFSEWDCTRIEVCQYVPWIRPIQLGCSLTEQRRGSRCDDIGENISDKNRSFAEMTGAYWIWKNAAGSKYKGLCHYRRHFIVSADEVMSLEKNKVDVILTTPRYVPGGIRNMFLAETPVKEQVYDKMLRAISEIFPEERQEFEDYMECCLYYPNNMVVAKNHIYDSYCAWIFPILFRMAEMEKECGYFHEGDRHIAYAAELLTSYYFVKNRDTYCIAVTDYYFYS